MIGLQSQVGGGVFLFLWMKGRLEERKGHLDVSESQDQVSVSHRAKSPPSVPILHMNSHPIWGALLRMVKGRLRHKKGPQETQRFLANHSLPITSSSAMHVFHINSHPIWGALCAWLL